MGGLERDDREGFVELRIVPENASALLFDERHEGLRQHGRFDLSALEHLQANRDLLHFKVLHGARGKGFRFLHAVKEIVDDGRRAHRRARPVEVAELFVLLHLGRDEHPEAALFGVRVGRRQNDLLLDARFVLREDVHQVSEVAVKTSRAHGRADFERRLEGNDLHVKAFLLEESFGLGHVKDGRIGRGKRPDFEGLGRSRRREGGRNRKKKTLGEFHRNSPFIL